MKTSRIKELNEMFTKGKEYKTYKIATPLQRFVNKLKYVVLNDTFIKLFIYLSAFVFTILFSIEL
tara:strand:- start:287 stop:481 length:195 start_codon:yes stop_codon:yes gene_type:complete